jgi:hypothetical protein
MSTSPSLTNRGLTNRGLTHRVRSHRGFIPRLAAAASALGLAAGLATATAGVAQANVPNKWGFALVSKPAVAGVPDLSHQAGSWPSPLHVHTTPGITGRVLVLFPRLASKNGVVHVTAISPPAGPTAVWCQAEKWAPSGLNEIVAVRCYKVGGVPIFAPFTVLYTTSSKAPFPAGSAYGYVHFEPAGGVVGTFNSTGGTNTVTPGTTGEWLVRLHGLGPATGGGNIQVTAVDQAGPAKCEVGGWGSGTAGGQRILVRCFNGGTTPLKTGWTLSYQLGRAIYGARPKEFAYTFNVQPTNPGPYVPLPAPVNFNSQAAVNTVQNGGGFTLVRFPRVGLFANTVLVTPFKIGAGFCNLLSVWATASGAAGVTVRDVVCYNAAGARIKAFSLITYASSH